MSIKKITETLEKGLDLSKRADNATRIHGEKFYFLFVIIIFLIKALLGIGVLCNVHDFMKVNLVLSFISIIAGTLVFTHPEILVTVANIDIINRMLPDNLQVDALDEIFQQFIKMSKRIIALCAMTFLFLGAVPLKDNAELFCIAFLIILILLLLDIEQKKEKK